MSWQKLSLCSLLNIPRVFWKINQMAIELNIFQHSCYTVDYEKFTKYSQQVI